MVVELYLGSTRVGSTTTDATGSYLFYATVPGSYVVRAARSGYADATSDLLKFSGTTISASFNLTPTGGGVITLPDLAITTTDVTFTPIADGSLTLTAMVHNRGGAPASDVHVRFYDASTGSGLGDFTVLSPEPVIASLAAGGATPVSVTFTPASGHRRFYAFADPNAQIAEIGRLNNGAFRDLGAELGGNRPVVSAVAAGFDWNTLPRDYGLFVSGAEGAFDRFTATVSAPDNDLWKVEFNFNGTVLTDTDGSDGWSETLDTGTLVNPSFTPIALPLIVTAYSRSGLKSDPFVGRLWVRGWPDWMKDNLTRKVGPVEISLDRQYLTIKTSLENKQFPGMPALFFKDKVDKGVNFIGDLSTDIEADAEFDVGIPLDPASPWELKGSIDATESFLGRTLATANGEITASVTQNGSEVTTATLHLEAGDGFSIPEKSVPIGQLWWVTFYVGVGMEGNLSLALDGTMQNNFASYDAHFTPSVTVTGHGSVSASLPCDLADLKAVVTPTMLLAPAVNYSYPPGDMSVSGLFTFQVNAKLVGSVGFMQWRKEGTLLSKDWGPWRWTYPRSEPFNATRASEISPAAVQDVVLPSVFPDPRLAVGPQGTLGLTWVGNVSPDPATDDPEIFFALRDSSDTWAAPQRITTNDRYESAPALAWTGDGRALAIWTQNSKPRDEPGQLTFSQILDRQDIWYALRSGSTWCAPAPLIADTAGVLHGDGTAVVAGTASGALAVWARSLGDSALAPGGCEIFSSRLTGTMWSAPGALTRDAIDDIAPSVVSAGGDSVLAAWLRMDPANAGQRSIAWALWDGSAWSPTRLLASSTAQAGRISLARAPSGLLLAAWGETAVNADSSLTYKLRCTSLQTGQTSWSAPEVVRQDSSFVETPTVMVDRRGLAVIVWRGYAGVAGDVFASLKDLGRPGAAWTAPRAISSDTLTDWMVTAAVDDHNNLQVVDLKSDLGGTPTPQSARNLFGQLAYSSRGITHSLDVSDQLNLGYRPLTSDLKLASADLTVTPPNPGAGDSASLSARVTNIGDYRSGATTVRFLVA